MGRKVTLIMPCYNAEQYIDVMIASVYAQIHDDVELICVDDGSTDNTRLKLDAWKPIIEKRGYTMIVKSKENGGVADAINMGLRLMTGDYVCFPDDDDMLLPGYVSKMLSCFEAHPTVKWVKCDAFSYNNAKYNEVTLRSESFHNYTDMKCLVENFLACRERWAVWTIMVRADFFRECFPDMRLEVERLNRRVSQEFQINLPLAYKSPYMYIDTPLYFYFNRSDGTRKSQVDTGYTQAVSYFEGCYDIARKVISKLNVLPEKAEKWEQIIDITLNLKRTFYATKFNQSELRNEHIENQLELIRPLLPSNIFKMTATLNSDYFHRLLADCAIDRIIYTPDELRVKLDSVTKEMYNTLKNNRVILYGGGEVGSTFSVLFKAMGIEPECIWDSNAEAMKGKISGIPILHPNIDKLTAGEKQEIVVVISIWKRHYEKEAMNLLQNNNIKNIVPVRDVHDMLRFTINTELHMFDNIESRG